MYTSFTIYDSSGNIIVSGRVLTEDLPHQLDRYPGAFLVEQESDPSTDIVDPVTNTILKGQRPPPPPPVKTYDQNRLNLYPDVGEQLDMLWHAMDTGTLTKAEPFYTYIKTIKDAYPKDNSTPTNSVSIISADNTP